MSEIPSSPPPNGKLPRHHAPADLHAYEPHGLGLRDLFGVLRRRWWLIVGTTALSLGGTYYLLSTETAEYRADALLRLRDAGAVLASGMLGEGGGSGGGRNADPFLSEIVVLQGRELARQVVEREGLRLFDLEFGAPSPLVADVQATAPPDSSRRIRLAFEAEHVAARTREGAVEAAYGVPVVLDGVRFTVPERPALAELELVLLPEESAADWVLSGLGARPRPGTDAIAVHFVSVDRALSVRMVNAVVQEYQALSASAALDQARRRRAFVEEQLQHTDDAFVTAQTALGKFRGREQVYRTDAMAAAEQAGIIQIEMRRGEIDADRRVYRSLLGDLEQTGTPAADRAFRTLIVSPGAASNPVIGQLYGRLTQQESTRDSLLVVGRPATHEEMRQLATLIAATRERLVEAVRSQLATLDARVATLDELRARSASEIVRLTPAEAEEVRLAQQVATMRSTGDQLRQEYQRARISEAVAVGQVEIIELASRASMLQTNRPLKLALGLALGLFLGSAIAFLREHLNSSIHRRTEMETVLHVPGLGIIPQLPKSGRRIRGRRAERRQIPLVLEHEGRIGGSDGSANGRAVAVAPTSLVTVNHSLDPSAEAYRGLRTKILYSSPAEAPLRSVVVTSATTEEGKTTTASNLATSFAQQGLRVLLVDCDLRRPRLHTLFNVRTTPGLTDALDQRADVQEAIRPTAVDRLHLLPSGTAPSLPAEVLGGERMRLMLAELAQQYDMVVLDTPPLLHASDAAVLAAMADGVLFVVRAGKTDRGMAQEAMHQLEAVGAHVIGAVLNDPDSKAAKYESYAYAYAYAPRA